MTITRLRHEASGRTHASDGEALMWYYCSWFCRDRRTPAFYVGPILASFARQFHCSVLDFFRLSEFIPCEISIYLECPVYEKLWVVTSVKVRDIDLDAFQIMSIKIGLDMLSVLLRRLFLGGVRSPVGDLGGSCMASTLVSLSSNIAAICWGSIGVV